MRVTFRRAKTGELATRHYGLFANLHGYRLTEIHFNPLEILQLNKQQPESRIWLQDLTSYSVPGVDLKLPVLDKEET